MHNCKAHYFFGYYYLLSLYLIFYFIIFSEFKDILAVFTINIKKVGHKR